MTIYILDNDPAICAEYLDDKSLNRMIKYIAQVLCNVHWMQPIDSLNQNIPLMPKKNNECKWTQWAKEYKANYNYLVFLGLQLCCEYDYRFFKVKESKKIGDHNLIFGYGHKYYNIIDWCEENIPDLPTRDHEIGCGCSECDNGFRKNITPLPLVMPKKYQMGTIEISTTNQTINDSHNRWSILAYRNYYQYKYAKSWQGHHCVSMSGESYYAEGKSNFKWTKRQPPEWINI